MIAVTFHGAGGPEVMAVDERPDPVPQSSEVLVRATHAAPANARTNIGRPTAASIWEPAFRASSR